MAKKMSARSSESVAPAVVAEECCGGSAVYTRSETIFFGLLRAVLGMIWLAQEVGWLMTNIKVGPLIVIAVGLIMVYSGMKLRE